MRETAVDVVIQVTGTTTCAPLVYEEQPPVAQRIELTPELAIGPLPDWANSEEIMDACSPRGLNFRPSRLFGARYALTRTHVPGDVPELNWDHDSLLRKALFLSRLIHPTTIAGAYSARLLFWDGNLRTIVPGQTQGLGAFAYVVGNEWRDWLTESEASDLRALLPKYLSRRPSERLRNARRHLDTVFHTFYLEHRIGMLVTAFESLLKVGRGGESRQFRTRLASLSAMVGEQVSSEAAWAFYDYRSSFVHGTAPTWEGVAEDTILMYQDFERTLRKAVLRASTDDEFASMFESDDSVRQHFPM